ncbi:ferredoxin-thioredoxin reductase catalytic domain-containing protein [Candidatus Latescibacterota bacterium]
MGNERAITSVDVEKLYEKLNSDAVRSGYNLNPDEKFTKDLVESLLINEMRYGYQACPCRLAAENKSEDLDIICPCYYRDSDLEEFDACYCGLYVSKNIVDGTKQLNRIPERRLPLEERERLQETDGIKEFGTQKYPVWRCKVCGYLCARDEPPGVCPVCKADKERFERFI